MNVKVNLNTAANRYNTPTQPMGAKSKETGAFLNAGDETSRVGKQDMGTFTERLAEAFKTDNAEIIRALDELSDNDKMEIAMRSYLQMQGRIYSAKSEEESDIKKFGSMKEEKAYYADMLEEAKENGTAEIKEEKDARFAFSDKKSWGEGLNTRYRKGYRRCPGTHRQLFVP